MTDNRPEPRTEAGRRMLRRRSYWSGNDDIRAAILAIEAEVMALYACGHLILGGKCSRPQGHAGAHSGEPEGKGG